MDHPACLFLLARTLAPSQSPLFRNVLGISRVGTGNRTRLRAHAEVAPSLFRNLSEVTISDDSRRACSSCPSPPFLPVPQGYAGLSPMFFVNGVRSLFARSLSVFRDMSRPAYLVELFVSRQGNNYISRSRRLIQARAFALRVSSAAT
jgi:hypothetical protein